MYSRRDINIIVSDILLVGHFAKLFPVDIDRLKERKMCTQFSSTSKIDCAYFTYVLDRSLIRMASLCQNNDVGTLFGRDKSFFLLLRHDNA